MNPSRECIVCCKDGANLWCTACLPTGAPHHENCWEKAPIHAKDLADESRHHCPITMKVMKRILYVNGPNERGLVEDKDFEKDFANCFIEFDPETQKPMFGPRANPLLHYERDRGELQCPSLVSFVGPTMNGKSFLLRALQYGGEANESHTPIPASQDSHDSTSSGIHLYADSNTAVTDSPILFLDCEGLKGSRAPRGCPFRMQDTADAAVAIARSKVVNNAYPRLVYTFSTCVVYVTSGPLAESTQIGKKLLSYSSKAALGSQNQLFKPSLFVIFNQFKRGKMRKSDWSIPSSTKKFLSHGSLKELQLYYGTIHVVYIPSFSDNDAAIAHQQLDDFGVLLRKEHDEAFRRRRDFHRDPTEEQLKGYIWNALDMYSSDNGRAFNWSIDVVHKQAGFHELIQDLWKQCARHHATLPAGPRELYRLTRETFGEHVEFCLRLGLTRKLPPNVRVCSIPKALESLVEQIDQLLLANAPCIAVKSPSQVECSDTFVGHGDYHHGRSERKAYRWKGHYQSDDWPWTTFRDTFEHDLKVDAPIPSLRNQEIEVLPPDVRSLTSCLGCLQGPPSTILACGHAFCPDCIRDLVDNDPSPHLLQTIWCPFHRLLQQFSPRLLPDQSGYRILSLDGGGVKGLAQLTMLRHIEKRCFDIPTTQLYDLIVGTSIGGQIALALTASTQYTPLTVSEATLQFKTLMKKGFVRAGFGVSSFLRLSLNGTIYRTSIVQQQLQGLFGKKAKLYAAVRSPPGGIPNVSVTTVSQDSFQAHLVANYNRKATAEAYPLLLGSDPDACMPIWAAARCTSAALPYFDAFNWQGRMFLDGGFQLNCPAAAAFSEARYIWPKKFCDVLVSLGTGTGTSSSNERPSHNLLQLFYRLLDAVTSSEGMWTKFSIPQNNKRFFRLNPRYAEGGFALDDFEKLDKIETQTNEWLQKDEQQVVLNRICDQLVAALFFFSMRSIKKGVLTGVILCRLPVQLPGRGGLIEQMQKELHLGLFRVNFGNKLTPIHVRRQGLPAVRLGGELVIPLMVSGLPDTGEIAIEMRNLGRGSPPVWSPTSGSPYPFGILP